MTDTPATHRVTEGLPDPVAALRLLADAEAADGVEAFGEAFVRGLTDADAGHRHFRVPAAEAWAPRCSGPSTTPSESDCRCGPTVTSPGRRGWPRAPAAAWCANFSR